MDTRLFGNGLNLGDVRLNQRALKLVELITADPALSFPKMADDWGTLKALYRFMSNDKITHQKILESHFEQTAARCASIPVVLAIQDTTVFNFEHHPETEGMGPLNNRRDKASGMLVHSVFTLNGQTKEPLGLLHQNVFVRQGWFPEKEKYYHRFKRSRESEKWFKGCRDVQKHLPRQTKVIEIADREADIFFLLKEITEAGQGFVIRAAKNRSTLDGYLFEDIKNAGLLGSGQIHVARNGNRKARIATVEIRACTVSIQSPRVIEHRGKSFPVNVVVIEEVGTPKETDPLYWVLLTSEPTADFDSAWKVMSYYQARWVIEEFHKGLKTGCQMEQRQLGSRHALENALALFSAVAVQLLYIRHQAAQPPTAEISNISISPSQLKIIQNKFPRESQELSPQKLLVLIARLGGFIGRKSDGNPGWQTLMHGFYELLLMDYGFNLAQKLVGKG